MTTNELMIGDWVYNKHHEKAIRITQFDFFTHGHRRDGTQYIVGLGQRTIGKDLAPIPLTPEILERNGWSEDRHHFPEDQDFKLEIYVVEDGRVFWTINLFEYDILPLQYVHQLQHALRLCGIDKEIML